MKQIEKMVVRLGWLPISVSLISLLLVLTWLLMMWQQSQIQQQVQTQTQQYQQQIFNSMTIVASERVKQWQTQLQNMAQLLGRKQSANDPDFYIDPWLAEQRQLFPAVKKICYFRELPTAPDENACIPIGFAALNAFRQMEERGLADVALIPSAEQSHILLVQAVTNGGALVMAAEPSAIDSLVDDSFVSGGYVELTQGTTNTSVISRYGDPQFKNAAATFSFKIPNSYWQLHYWAKPEMAAVGGWLILGLVLGLLLVFWLLQQVLLYKLLGHDANSLEQQLTDLEEKRLKPKYQHVWRVFHDVSDVIQRLGVVNDMSKKKVQPAVVTPVELEERSIIPLEDVPAKAETRQPENRVEPVQAAATLEITPLQPESMLEEDELDPAIFKAYDIRGIVGEQLDDDVMLQIGQAVGSEALDQGQHQFVVGRDGRLSSDALSKAFIKGLLSSGCDVIDIGCVPTPLVYFACEHLGTHSGAVVTGSHNPVEYNGLKVIIGGKTLAGEAVQNLHQRILTSKLRTGQGRQEKKDIREAYIERIKADVKLARSINVVVDCGNGVAGAIVPQLLRAIGCQVTELYCDVDGNFPNHHPDPGQPENLQDLKNAVIEHEAELGLAFDGDGDRLGVVDGQGEIIWPDRLLILLAQHLLVEQPGATIIYDVKSTNLLEDVISRGGGQPMMMPSGHSVIKNKMSEVDAKLAGELSGHIFFKDRWYGFDDALYSAARLLEFLAVDPLERTPTEVFSALPKRVTTPEILFAMPVDESQRLVEQLQAKAEFETGKVTTIDGVRVDWPNGWGLVRASNTMPGLSLRFEAVSQEELEHIKQMFIQQILQINPTLSLLF